jgi:PAS domain S-box-containing protein
MLQPTIQDPETLVALPARRIFFQADCQGRIICCNEIMVAFLGIPEEQLLHAKFTSLAEPAEERNAGLLVESASQGIPETGYVGFMTPAGRKLAQVTLVPQFSNGQVAGVFGFMHDATDRIQKTERLEASEEQYRALYERYQFMSEATSDVLWDWNLETNDIDINQSFTRVLGYEIPEKNINLVWLNNLYPDDRDRIISGQQAAIRNPLITLWEDQYRFVRPEGDIMYLEDRAVIIRDDAGRALRMIGAVHDVTRQREFEQRIQRGERRFRAMVQSGLDVVVLLDSNFGIRYISPNALSLGGYLPSELMGALGFNTIHPDDYYQIIQDGKRILLEPVVVLRPFRIRIKDDSYRWVEAKLSNHLEDFDIEAIVINLRDITDRLETEETIRLSEEKYRLLFYQSPEPKWIFRRNDLRFVEVNDAATNHYGYSREEFLSMTVIDLQPTSERERVKKMLHGDFMPAGRMQNASHHITRDGTVISVELTTHGIYLEDGYHVLVIANDVTEKLELEQKVLEEKITAQKAIARTIINTQEKERSEIGKELHDNVNQLLTTTKLYIENIAYYPHQRDTYVEKSSLLLQKAITEIRNLSKALVTPVLYDIGFRPTLEELMEQFRDLNLFLIHFDFEADEKRIEDGLRLTIYRILQEQLNNIVMQQKRNGLGLNNMKNRIEVFKGSVDVKSDIGQGCQVCIYLPL